MYFGLKDTTAEILAKSRLHDALCDLPLDLIDSELEAYDIQASAQDALGFERKGYAIVGSSESARRALGLAKPIYSEIPALALASATAVFRLPPSVIGAQCEFTFTMRRAFPDADEPISLETVADAVAACRPAIGIIGRRTGRAFAGDNAAIADFGLHVATVQGSQTAAVDLSALGKLDVNVFLFREIGISGNASSVMGHPLNAVAWLAGALSCRGKQLQTGDVVATGACTKVLRVHAGQHVAADFGPLGQVECIFE
ncbi:2-keto-4-pentenoate hydratase [Rhizobium leguminosarum]|jgi:2-oxo-3-hexenedioate decarboxylase/2-keto-4-pentenoate hydratase|uniref:Hydratase n=1 Tax=Rhizobium leguminosarum TaxID=384 RepID=A0A444P5E3_RHILE|nr:hydratase [Rhizobium leguminosarum]RWY83235.1 hydratase [Rhizobium leguminosarum]TAU79430.1 hydratase [Rhizobium leguminosarum]TAV85013.1 hydratase [Rhizobium leguminosarum]TAV86270.1 hydratase [Rhizobium leguminosarum]TAW27478.1 hydratase [Rhizobium leguminosarum]